MYSLFVALARFLNSQHAFFPQWLSWTLDTFRHAFIMWPFPLLTYPAFLVSALLQAFIQPVVEARSGARAGARAGAWWSPVLLGATGRPDWRSNLARFEDLLQHGASPATAFTFVIASYNLTIYFLILTMVLNGPQITIGHVVAVLVMIAFVRQGLRWFVPTTRWDSARARSDGGPAAVASAAALSWTARLGTGRAWLDVARHLGRDVKVLFVPILIGLIVGGFLAAWGRTPSFFELNLGGAVWAELVNAVIGPLLGVVTFMVPVLNIFVGAWLWKTEFVTYAGLVGFFLATVLHPDAVGTYRRLFGGPLTTRIVGIILGAAALAALAVTVMWALLAGLASLVGIRAFVEQTILGSSITPSPVPWFHRLFQPAINQFMKDAMGGMGGMTGMGGM